MRCCGKRYIERRILGNKGPGKPSIGKLDQLNENDTY